MLTLKMFGRSVPMKGCEASYVLRSHSLSNLSLSTYCNKMQNNCIIQITTPLRCTWPRENITLTALF